MRSSDQLLTAMEVKSFTALEYAHSTTTSVVAMVVRRIAFVRLARFSFLGPILRCDLPILAQGVSLSPFPRLFEQPFDVGLELVKINPPNAASPELDGGQLTRAHKRVDLGAADV